MENQEQKNHDNIPENPKPTDQLQEHIETVTPDTEKDVKPTEQNSKNENGAGEVDQSDNGKQVDEKADNEEGTKPTEDTAEESEVKSGDTEEVANEETKVDEDKKDGSPYEAIETVSP